MQTIREVVKADYLNGLKLLDICEKHDIPMNTLKSWIKRYHWAAEKRERFKGQKRQGAPFNNKNAVGNNGGAPKRNQNALKHGLYQKYLPDDTKDIMDELEGKSPLDIIWDAIKLQYAAIIRSQQIMFVNDHDDRTSTMSREGGKTLMEIQEAWDKQASFLKAQSAAISALKNAVKDYLELEGENKTDASEEIKDWKDAVIEIAKRRKEMDNERACSDP